MVTTMTLIWILTTVSLKVSSSSVSPWPWWCWCNGGKEPCVGLHKPTLTIRIITTPTRTSQVETPMQLEHIGRMRIVVCSLDLMTPSLRPGLLVAWGIELGFVFIYRIASCINLYDMDFSFLTLHFSGLLNRASCLRTSIT